MVFAEADEDEEDEGDQAGGTSRATILRSRAESLGCREELLLKLYVSLLRQSRLTDFDQEAAHTSP